MRAASLLTIVLLPGAGSPVIRHLDGGFVTPSQRRAQRSRTQALGWYIGSPLGAAKEPS